MGDTTWEKHDSCKQLEALDRYLELHGVRRPAQLQRRVGEKKGGRGNKPRHPGGSDGMLPTVKV